MRHICLGTLALASCLGFAGTATAAEPDSARESESGWQFAATPYVWASAISVDMDLDDHGSVDSDTSFTEILGDLKFVFMGAFEARNDRFVMITDIIYLSVGSEADGPAGFVDADVDLATFIGTAVAGYRVVEEGPLFVDLFAGGRVTSIDAEVELTGPFQSVESDASKTRVSPVVAGRFRLPLGERWGVAVYGDLAGFGITSDLPWQLLGTVQYDLSNHWRLAAGYRHVAVETETGNSDVDVALSGPILGFSYRF